jgi:hypothetical protein
MYVEQRFPFGRIDVLIKRFSVFLHLPRERWGSRRQEKLGWSSTDVQR